VEQEIENIIGIDKSEVIRVSGKTGENVEQVLDAIIERIQDPDTFKKAHPKKYRPKEIIKVIPSPPAPLLQRGENWSKIIHEIAKKKYIY